MMSTRTLGVLMVIAALGCKSEATPKAGVRTTIVPAPGVYDADVARDGRITFSGYVDGKAAIFVANNDGANPQRRSFGVWDAGNVEWSPDGKWITFGRDAGGGNDALIVRADSGAERVVATSPADELPAGWLADASGVLFTRSSPRGTALLLYQLADGSTAPLFEVDGSVTGYPSNDGAQIVYQLTKDGKRTLWIYERATKKHRQLTTEGFESLSFRPFSPDGKFIVYESRRSGTSDLWRIDVATGARQQLTQDIADDFRALWSPDGSRIAFTSNRGGQPDIWVLSTGESDVHRVTDDTQSETTYGWTPDGSALVMAVGAGHQHLYALPAAGGPAVALTSGEWDVVGGAGTASASVSRDGQHVAFTATKSGDPDVWVVDVSGGEPRLVAGGPGNDADPTWSPDGNRIAFTSTRSGNRDIWVVPTAGGTPTQLTKWSGSEGSARWSPSGDEIAFVSDHESAVADLWIAPANGGAPRRVTTMGTVGDFRWSPDGKFIAFTAQAAGGGGPAIFTVPASGGQPRQVGPAPSFAAGWSPNGAEIKMSMCKDGYCSTEIRSPAGVSLRNLSSAPPVYEFDAGWSPDGASMAIAYQNLSGDGGNLVAIRPAAGGPARVLDSPAKQSMYLVGFAADGKFVITTGVPRGNTLDRVAVPSAARPR